MAKWNGYSLETQDNNTTKFEFDCRHCGEHMSGFIKKVEELKTFRTAWRQHVDTHGGPYS